MAYQFVLCDVFADRPFSDNQLDVFLEAGGVSDETMKELGREFGWSEITFVLDQGGDRPQRVRIWTPQGELPFAGHPTIGTAAVLAAEGRIEVGWSVLELGIGSIAVEVTRSDAFGGHAAMTQRAPVFGRQVEDRRGLARALGLQEDDLVPELPAQVVSTGLDHLLVPVRDLEALGRADPRRELSAVVAEVGVSWAYIFSADTTDSAARARLVAPGMEDPATGSAAGPLGAYLVHYGLHRSGEMDIEQGIEMGRPSRIRVDVPQEGGELGPIRVSGEVHIWARGAVEVPDPQSRIL